MKARCVSVFAKYGQSLGCFSAGDQVSDRGDGSSLLTVAILNGENEVVSALRQAGASLGRNDDYGISPRFWLSVLGQESPTLEGALARQIERLDIAAKISFENKHIVYLPPIQAVAGKKISDLRPPNALAKMGSGYQSVVGGTVFLSVLRMNPQDSIIGFIDNLMKESGSKKQGLDSILFDAKLKLIRLVASGQAELDPIHIMAIFLYTADSFILEQANLALSDWGNKKLKMWQPFVHCLYRAVSLLPIYVGEIYRGIDGVEFCPEYYPIGAQITWGSFCTCSKERGSVTDLFKRGNGIVFIVKSKTGRDISKYSCTPADSEVLFLPESTFIVRGIYRPDPIALGQENIRVATFTANEKDFDKASKGLASIIIEVEECLGADPRKSLSIPVSKPAKTGGGGVKKRETVDPSILITVKSDADEGNNVIPPQTQGNNVIPPKTPTIVVDNVAASKAKNAKLDEDVNYEEIYAYIMTPSNAKDHSQILGFMNDQGIATFEDLQFLEEDGFDQIIGFLKNIPKKKLAIMLGRSCV